MFKVQDNTRIHFDYKILIKMQEVPKINSLVMSRFSSLFFVAE